MAERQFTEQLAARELTEYQRKGPGATTRLLQEGIAAAGAMNGLLLDVGSGIGSLTFELLARGVARAIAVDASAAYIAAASKEAARRGRADAIQLVHGDFLTVASQLPTADVVALDRVVCCYPYFEPLLEEAARHASHCLAFAYPRDTWPTRTAVQWENAARRFKRNPFRTVVHSAAAMEHVVRRAGFTLVSRRRTWRWSIDVYRKTPA